MKMTDLTEKVETLLAQVDKPASYMGGEWGSVMRDENEAELNYGFCFPDKYEIGMSYLGLQIIYHVLNETEGVYCQRVFAPGSDMEALMRETGLPLFTEEKKNPVSQMDVLGFTLQYELSFTNILNMLDLAGIPLKSCDRGEEDPLVCAGGNCSYNPEPLADFIDFYMIGDGEDVLVETAQLMIERKRMGYSRRELLEKLCQVPGVYVPSLYEPEYDETGRMTGHRKLFPDAPDTVVKRMIMDMDSVSYPLNPIVPFMDVVHDRSVIELFRGCTRGCRFCQAGIICRPIRERSAEKVKEYAEAQLKNTGYDEMSLLSLSTSDYSKIEPLVTDLMSMCRSRETGLSLPSMRLDSFSPRVLDEISTFRKTGLTFAPEAGTQRMRDVINKNISEEDILSATKQAIELGYNNIKLYFMIGLPGETDEDIAGIADIAGKISWIARKDPERRGKFNVTVSVSNFVPKADTPFQWAGQNTPEEFDRKHYLLRDLLKKKKGVSYQYHGSDTSFLEAVFARGDRRTGKSILRAFELGCKFDSWSESFDYGKWLQAFEETGVDPTFYSQRTRDRDEYLPWEIIDCGVTKKYMLAEYDRAMAATVTHDCREGCTGCGLRRFVECPVYEKVKLSDVSAPEHAPSEM